MANSYNSFQAIELGILTLLVGREARGQTEAAMMGVAWSVRNRVVSPRWWGHDWISVMSKPYQYTSMVPPPKDKDPNLTVYPDLSKNEWRLAMEAAESAYWASDPDPTSGATHYYDSSLDSDPPSWATDKSSEHVCDIDNLRFFKAH